MRLRAILAIGQHVRDKISGQRVRTVASCRVVTAQPIEGQRHVQQARDGRVQFTVAVPRIVAQSKVAQVRKDEQTVVGANDE